MSFYDDLIIINPCLFIMFLVIISIMVHIRHSICSLTGLKNYMDKREIIKTDFFIDEFEEILLKGDITFFDEDYCRLITELPIQECPYLLPILYTYLRAVLPSSSALSCKIFPLRQYMFRC